jgi:hypothetical protein
MMSDPRICREFIKGTCYRQSCQFVHSYEGDGRGGGDDRGRYGYDRGAPKPNPSIRELYPHNNDAGQGQGNKGQQPTPGDWLCGPCDTLNFKKRDTCCRCNAARANRSLDLTSGNIRWYLERRERQEERRKRRKERPMRYAEAAERRKRREREREERRAKKEAAKAAKKADGAKSGDATKGSSEAVSQARTNDRGTDEVAIVATAWHATGTRGDAMPRRRGRRTGRVTRRSAGAAARLRLRRRPHPAPEATRRIRPTRRRPTRRRRARGRRLDDGVASARNGGIERNGRRPTAAAATGAVDD